MVQHQPIGKRVNGTHERAHRPYQLLSAHYHCCYTNTGGKMKGSHPRAADWCPFVPRHSWVRLPLSCSWECYGPRQNGRHFADDIFKCIFLNENVWIRFKISLKFVPQGPINNIPALVQIMAWRRPGDKPLSGPVMVRLPTHICVTRPQWVNGDRWILFTNGQQCGNNFHVMTSSYYAMIIIPIDLFHRWATGWISRSVTQGSEKGLAKSALHDNVVLKQCMATCVKHGAERCGS